MSQRTLTFSVVIQCEEDKVAEAHQAFQKQAGYIRNDIDSLYQVLRIYPADTDTQANLAAAYDLGEDPLGDHHGRNV